MFDLLFKENLTEQYLYLWRVAFWIVHVILCITVWADSDHAV